MPTPLALFLRDHEAAGRAGLDLVRRAAKNQRKRPWADDLRALADEAREDLSSLQLLMRRLGVAPDPVLGTALRLGERAGRLKPNGHLLRRAPLSDLVEVEGVISATVLKAAGWSALDAARVVTDGDPDLPALLARADDQLQRLRGVHRAVAASTLPAVAA